MERHHPSALHGTPFVQWLRLSVVVALQALLWVAPHTDAKHFGSAKLQDPYGVLGPQGVKSSWQPVSGRFMVRLKPSQQQDASSPQQHARSRKDLEQSSPGVRREQHAKKSSSRKSRAHSIMKRIKRSLPNTRLLQEFSTVWEGFSLQTSSINETLAALDGEFEVLSVWPVVWLNPPDLQRTDVALSALHGVLNSADMSSLTSGSMSRLASGGFGRLNGWGIKVGIIDTGVDYSHPGLGGGFGPGYKVAFGRDFAGDNFKQGAVPWPDADPMDCMGHGTHVAGVIAGDYSSPDAVPLGAAAVGSATSSSATTSSSSSASGDPASAFRFRGVAPGVTLGAYKVFGCSGGTTSELVVAAFEQAYADGMQIINFSIGDEGAWQGPVAEAAERLANLGVLIVAAAGNAGPSGLFMQGSVSSSPSVLSVGSVEGIYSSQAIYSFTLIDQAGQPRRLSSQSAYGDVMALKSSSVRPSLDLVLGRPADSCTRDGVGAMPGATVALVRNDGACDIAVKVGCAAAAGARGVILIGSPAVNGGAAPALPGPYALPVVSLDAASGDLILAAVPHTYYGEVIAAQAAAPQPSPLATPPSMMGESPPPPSAPLPTGIFSLPPPSSSLEWPGSPPPLASPGPTGLRTAPEYPASSPPPLPIPSPLPSPPTPVPQPPLLLPPPPPSSPPLPPASLEPPPAASAELPPPAPPTPMPSPSPIAGGELPSPEPPSPPLPSPPLPSPPLESPPPLSAVKVGSPSAPPPSVAPPPPFPEPSPPAPTPLPLPEPMAMPSSPPPSSPPSSPAARRLLEQMAERHDLHGRGGHGARMLRGEREQEQQRQQQQGRQRQRQQRRRSLLQSVSVLPVIVGIDGNLMSSFSSWGPDPQFRIKPQLVAPGGTVLSTVPRAATPGAKPLGSGFGYLSGTSQAAPYVSGAAALYLQANKARSVTAQQVMAAFMNTARPVPSINNYYESPLRAGAGVVDLAAMVTTLVDVSPPTLQLESNLQRQAFVLEINNRGKDQLGFVLEHKPSQSINANALMTLTLSPTSATNELTLQPFNPMSSDVEARVSFSTTGLKLQNLDVIVVPGYGRARVRVQLQVPANGLTSNVFFSGNIVLRPDPSTSSVPDFALGTPLSVPYLGFSAPATGLPTVLPSLPGGLLDPDGRWWWDMAATGFRTVTAPPYGSMSPPPPDEEFWGGGDGSGDSGSGSGGYGGSSGSGGDGLDWSPPPYEDDDPSNGSKYYKPGTGSGSGSSATPAAPLFTYYLTGARPSLPSVAVTLQRQPLEVELWLYDAVYQIPLGEVSLQQNLRRPTGGVLVLPWRGTYTDPLQGREMPVGAGDYFFRVRLMRTPSAADKDPLWLADEWTSPSFRISRS